MFKKNLKIREAAKSAGVPLWAIAGALGISEPTMTRKMRRELPADEQEKILGVIGKIANERG